ncbi:MAG: MauE/DoxX family redox-associated membrane protein [Planctomycetota bacterium]
MKALFATNMRCQSCLDKVNSKLDGALGVIAWKADLQHPDKWLDVELKSEHDIPMVRQLVAEAGFETKPIDRVDAAIPSPSVVSLGVSEQKTTDESGRFWQTYRPLLLVVGYVLLLSGLIEWWVSDQAASWSWGRFQTWFMGFFFLGFAFFKLLDVGRFADAFATYDVIARQSHLYALAYPFIEFGLGMLFVLRVGLTFASGFTAILMAVGLVGVVSAVLRRERIQCACLGTVFQLPMSVVTIIENTIMLVMAIGMLVFRSIS